MTIEELAARPKLSSAPVAATAARDAFAHLVSGIAVVGTGQLGTTIGSLTSWSLSPATIIFGVQQGSQLHRAVLVEKIWGVSVLAKHQSPVANRFAGRDPVADRGIEGLITFHGVAVVPEAILWLRVRRTLTRELGDHLLVMAEITHYRAFTGSPLTYFRREFGTVEPGN